jgi:hypothetical protein
LYIYLLYTDIVVNYKDMDNSSRETSNFRNFGEQIARNLLPLLLNLVRPRSRETEEQTQRTSSPSSSESSSMLGLSAQHEEATTIAMDEQQDPIPSHEMEISQVQEDARAQGEDGAEQMDILSELTQIANEVQAEQDAQEQDQQMQDVLPVESSSEQPTNDEANAPQDERTHNRPRYRLVVYFEERARTPTSTSPAASQEGGEQTPSTDSAPSTPTHDDRNRQRLRYIAVILGELDHLQHLVSGNMDDLLNHLFNAYVPKGSPPARKDVVENLPTITATGTEDRCPVCLEDFAPGAEAILLPCKHMFHGDECVKHWLQQHNSCPVCRYEFPVDDPDYEEERKQRMIARGFNDDPYPSPDSTSS